MKIRTLLSLAFVAAGVFANADFDQILNPSDAYTTNLTSADTFGVSQIFAVGNNFNAMILADFTSAGTVTGIDAAFEFSRAAALNNVTGWRVSVFGSPAAANGGGNNLNPVTSVDVVANALQYTAISGSASTSTPTLVSLQGLNLSTGGAGVRWIGVAAILAPGASNDQAFLMTNYTPKTLGGVGNNDVCVQPGDGFGFGGPTVIDSIGANAAYRVATVPEPATMVALGAGLLAIARRRRSK